MDPLAQPFVTSPKRISSKPNWIITSDEVEQGCILWLGTSAETAESQRCRDVPSTPVINAQTRLPANEGMHEHPFLVFSRPASDPSKIYFLPMTSLGGQSLAQKFTTRKAPYHQATFLPITPADMHPLYLAGDIRYRTLTLQNGDHLEKSTYVNVRELYEMDWRDAQLYWGSNPNLRKKWKLDVPSLQAVIHLATINLKMSIERQYFPHKSPLMYTPRMEYVQARSQLLSPLNRRLSQHANMVQRCRTIPAYGPITPPQRFVKRSPMSPSLHSTAPQPFVRRSPTEPSLHMTQQRPPTIHPALQAEFSPRTSPVIECTERSQQAQRAVEERQPLLPSYNPQNPVYEQRSVERERPADEADCEAWTRWLCSCWVM